MKPVKLRPAAERDLVEAARYHAEVGGLALGEQVFDAALASSTPIQRMPGLGSLRLGQRCEVPGLRSWWVKGFPMQWLYFEAATHLDVVRLVGDRQDILVILSNEADDVGDAS